MVMWSMIILVNNDDVCDVIVMMMMIPQILGRYCTEDIYLWSNVSTFICFHMSLCSSVYAICDRWMYCRGCQCVHSTDSGFVMF